MVSKFSEGAAKWNRLREPALMGASDRSGQLPARHVRGGLFRPDIHRSDSPCPIGFLILSPLRSAMLPDRSEIRDIDLLRLYTPSEIASKWGCSERRLRHVARQTGACLVIGRRMYIRPGHLEALLEAFRPAPETSAPRLSPGPEMPTRGYREALARLSGGSGKRRRLSPRD